MPRTARRCPAGKVFHVLNRSVARIRLFRGEKDYVAFERTLEEALARTPVDLFTFCVMPTHWHFVLRPTRDGDLSRFMQWLTLAHAQRWRTSHETVGYGPLYQGRFKAFAIQEDAHLLTVLRYVERNPLRAGLVRRAEDWRWSGLHRRMSGSRLQRAILTPWPLPVPADWLQWVNAPQTPAEEEAIRTSINRSRPYGTADWQRAAARTLGLASCFRPPGRPKAQKSGARVD